MERKNTKKKQKNKRRRKIGRAFESERSRARSSITLLLFYWDVRSAWPARIAVLKSARFSLQSSLQRYIYIYIRFSSLHILSTLVPCMHVQRIQVLLFIWSRVSCKYNTNFLLQFPKKLRSRWIIFDFGACRYAAAEREMQITDTKYY